MLCAAPNNKWHSGAVDLDDKGFVLTGDSVGLDEPGWAHSLTHPLVTSCLVAAVLLHRG
jgi:hypothetical protein